METPARQLHRVLLALEDLAAQEELLLRSEDYLAVPPLQLRAAPLVECLVVGAGAADGPLRQRISAVIARRARSQQGLVEQLIRVRDELLQIQTSRQRIAQVAPAYCQPAGVPPQLQVRG
jgi:hypothetical protein